MYRNKGKDLEFFLVHPGGPFWATRNEGAWSIPKGEPEQGEELLETAQREFFEETGIKPTPPFTSLGSVKQKSGKVVHAWTFKGNWDPATGITSNLIKIAWPPSSKKFIDIPEVDKAEWMSFDKASLMINPAQAEFLTKAVLVVEQSNR